MKFVYLFVNIPFIWKCKIGISKNVRNRRKHVSKSTPGIAIPIWFVFIPFAEGVEKTLHGFFKAFHSPFRRGSGRSEWYLTFPVLPLAWIILNFMMILYWAPLVGLIWWYVTK